MTDYRELAAAELAKIRQANDELAARARTARDGRQLAADMEAETSFRLAEDYTILAALEAGVLLPSALPQDRETP